MNGGGYDVINDGFWHCKPMYDKDRRELGVQSGTMGPKYYKTERFASGIIAEVTGGSEGFLLKGPLHILDCDSINFVHMRIYGEKLTHLKKTARTYPPLRDCLIFHQFTKSSSDWSVLLVEAQPHVIKVNSQCDSDCCC